MRQNKTTTITDWHCHILPGIDDGAKTLDDAIAIASILVDNGFSEVYCTPHCMKGVFENTPEIVRQAVIALQAELDKVEIPLKLHVGMEYFLDEFFPQQLNNPLTLGNTNYLLVEAPIRADPKRIKDFLFTIRRRGCTPLLAHPERYEFLAPAAPPITAAQPDGSNILHVTALSLPAGSTLTTATPITVTLDYTLDSYDNGYITVKVVEMLPGGSFRGLADASANIARGIGTLTLIIPFTPAELNGPTDLGLLIEGRTDSNPRTPPNIFLDMPNEALWHYEP